MKTNFDFLECYWPALSQIGGTAESYLYSDPNACIYKLGMFGERLVAEIFAFENLPLPQYDDTLANRIKVLKYEGLVKGEIDNILYVLRKTRNDAVHAGLDSPERAKTLLEMTYKLACWFMEVYGDWEFIPEPFVMPTEEPDIDYAALLAEKEAEIQQLTSKIESVTTIASTKTIKERASYADTVSEGMELNEAETRLIIDAQLRSVGWEANTTELRYSAGVRPQKGRNLAIAEWPTLAANGDHGRADYALFIGLQLVGIIEAKRAMVDIPSVVDYQCKDYARSIRQEDQQYCINQWGEFRVPFVFATNGRKYLEQLKMKSGIWFQDLRNSLNLSKALRGWISPDGIMEMLEKDIAAANAALENTPFDMLRDSDGLNLREYQIRAIEAAEKAIIKGKETVLLSMATGTGKTRTVLGMIYRFLKTNRFKRILFLVDRTALGDQAQDVFKDVKIEELMTLNSIYNIKELGDTDFDKETRIQVATVQSLVKRILYADDETTTISVSAYDLIIVDEAHRGYLLDKEMSETELLYRDQADYISKYRTVIEYFDAVKIALTATPALHTSEIFGKPVFNYSYREAVIDGYLVDHDAPHDIHTKLRDEGIRYRAGEQLAIYDPVTGQVLNGDELEDDLAFDVDTFNRKVITENFNRAVLGEIANDLNPDGEGKTLIYAVDDDHAEMIVSILRETYAVQGIPPEAIMKITGKISNGNKKKIAEAIRRFKNEQYPNIVVTVDLLTTGIDVPEITTLVFMRRIRSRILFEQMLGRATRLCPKINKTHFEIYDPVGVYEALGPVNTMKAVSSTATFAQLLQGLELLPDDTLISLQIDLIVAKLRRKSHRVSTRAVEHFNAMTHGHSLKSFANQLHGGTAAESKMYALDNKDALIMLDSDYVRKPGGKIIDDHADIVTAHHRGYGKGQRPEDYLDAFKDFIMHNMNEIEALKIVCTRPGDLTREVLKSLRLELDRHDFNEIQLNTAWHDMTNQDITANIISFIRQQALGSVLISHENRVKHAFARLKQEHSFNAVQISWLSRIEKTMLEDAVLDETTFEMGAYKTHGGFAMIDRRFGGQLKEYIRVINTYIYDDGGQVA